MSDVDDDTEVEVVGDWDHDGNALVGCFWVLVFYAVGLALVVGWAVLR